MLRDVTSTRRGFRDYRESALPTPPSCRATSNPKSVGRVSWVWYHVTAPPHAPSPPARRSRRCTRAVGLLPWRDHPEVGVSRQLPGPRLRPLAHVPSAKAWSRHAIRRTSHVMFPAVVASPNTSAYLSRSAPAARGRLPGSRRVHGVAQRGSVRRGRNGGSARRLVGGEPHRRSAAPY